MGSVALEGFGGGGASLNFKVVGNPKPASPKENTIWIDTDRINNYYFTVTQPENMVDYDVWISTGTSSTVAFSATTKNPIMVYPVAAKQYIGGVLVNLLAKSWQRGEWVEWVPEGALYYKGNECTNITGGWEGDYTGDANTKGTFIKNASSISLKITNGQAILASPINNINLTNVSAVNVNITEMTALATHRRLAILKPSSSLVSDNFVSSKVFDKIGIVSIDTSTLSGLYRIAIYYGAGVTGTLTFDEVMTV